MNLYIVHMPNGDTKIESEFGATNHRIAPNLWAVGSDLSTCVDVCQSLGVKDGQSMVVASMSEYYGHFDRALWQKLDAWGKA